MNRLIAIREDLSQFHRAEPFKPFALILENGTKILIEHPENIAYSSISGGADTMSIYSGNLRYIGPMSAITSIVSVERGELEIV